MAQLGRKVVVYGPSGSGKSTLARALGARLGLPVVELDAVFHARPNWDDLSTEEFREAVTKVLAAHPGGWVIDGNYGAVRDLILPHATTAIWLRLPFRVVYPRLAWRTVVGAVRHESLWGTNYESLRNAFASRDSMLLWGITDWRRHHRTTRAALAAAGPGTRVVVLRSPGAVRRFLASARG